MVSALRPSKAAQVLLATTAMPPSGANLAGGAEPFSSTMRSTPFTCCAFVASKDLTLPPTTGGRATTAYFIPGTRTSAP
jgi:hypothetical protein